MKRILFPIDFSHACRHAGHAVKALAQKTGAEVTMLHAIEPVWQGGTVEYADFIIRATLPEEQECQRRIAAKFLDHEFAGLNVKRVVETGDPSTLIREYVGANQVDLVMMPTHGLGVFRRFLVGSVTAKVLHDVPCPVWTDAHLEQNQPSPIEAPRCVLCALDLSEGGEHVLKAAQEWSSLLGFPLCIVHVLPLSEISQQELYAAELYDRVAKDVRNRIGALQKAAGVTAAGIHLTYGSVGRGIAEAAIELGAAVVITGRGCLPDTFGRLLTHTYAIIRDTPCPVVSI